jgi:hypothetical protein
MTVCAPDYAFIDLESDGGPVPASNHPPYVHQLGGRIDVIELKARDIGLAAIEARVVE